MLWEENDRPEPAMVLQGIADLGGDRELARHWNWRIGRGVPPFGVSLFHHGKVHEIELDVGFISHHARTLALKELRLPKPLCHEGT